VFRLLELELAVRTIMSDVPICWCFVSFQFKFHQLHQYHWLFMVSWVLAVELLAATAAEESERFHSKWLTLKQFK